MATENFTLNGDNFTGTAGNDWFKAAPEMHDGDLENTLQTIDTVEGGAGWDTIEASLIGGEDSKSQPKEREHNIWTEIANKIANLSIAFV